MEIKRFENEMYLLSEETSIEKIMSILTASFGIENNGDMNTLRLNNKDIAIDVVVISPEQGEEQKKKIKEQVNGIAGHFYQTEADNPEIKTNLITYLLWMQSLIFIKYSFEEKDIAYKEEFIQQPFLECLDALNGVLLIQGKSSDGIFILDDNHERKCILADDGTTQLDHYMPKRKEIPFQDAPRELLERRKRTFKILDEKNLMLPQYYPFVEQEEMVECRTKEEIVKRALALLVVSIYSECLLGHNMSVEEANHYVKDIIEKYGITEDFFSPKEYEYLQNQNPEENEKVGFSWQYENLFICEWALGLMEMDFPDHICDVAGCVNKIMEFDSFEAIINGCNVRTDTELLDADDLIYCLDWSCVDNRIHNLPTVAGLDGGVVMERHKTLDWLVGADDRAEWDEVVTNT